MVEDNTDSQRQSQHRSQRALWGLFCAAFYGIALYNGNVDFHLGECIRNYRLYSYFISHFLSSDIRAIFIGFIIGDVTHFGS